MVWKHENITIKAGQPWSDKDGVQHPANWMIWTDPEKKDKGLTWEDEADTSFDNRFYWSKGVEKSLADTPVTDEKGEKVTDPMTGEQMVEKGLKTQYIAQTKQTANDLMSSSDWMIIRNAEKSTAIPEATTKYRDSVRTKCAEIETAINACSSLADFIKLFDVPKDKDGNASGNAPMYDWPTE